MDELGSYEPRKKQSAQLPKTSLKSFSRNEETDLFETVREPKKVTISNTEATEMRHKSVIQQYQDVIFKPRRAVTKSLDFNATATNRLRNTGNQTQLEGPTATHPQFNSTLYTQVGSRFSANNHVALHMGHSGASGSTSPPRMICYRPNMHETDLVASLHRFISNEELRSTQFNGSPIKASKHTMRPKDGFNDVSRYTWSSVQPASSDLPPNMEEQAYNALR